MILRSTLEKLIPLQDGEEHLLPKTRKTVLRGMYAGRVTITGARQTLNYRATSKDAYPYKLEVTRVAKDGSKRFTGDQMDDPAWSEPFTDVLDDIRKSGVIARANRIERIARRVKLVSGGVAVAGLVTLIALGGGSESDSPSQPNTAIESCAQVVDGSETLIPIEDSVARTLQKAGETVCSLADTNYLVSTPSAAG